MGPGPGGDPGADPGAAWTAYGALTALHLAFNVLALRALRLDDPPVKRD